MGVLDRSVGRVKERAPYSRVYWSIQHDPKFDGIREDMRLIGSWVTLLVVADQTWPAPAYPPPIVSKSSMKALADAGLIDLMTGGRYRIHGLDSERAKRAEAGRAGGLASGKARAVEPSLNGSSTVVEPEKHSREKQSTADARDEWDDGRTDLEAFLLVTRRAPTPKQRLLLDGLADRHDLTGPQWAADIIMRNPTDPIGALIEADKAWRAERIAEAQSAEKPVPKPRRKRGLPTSTKEILDYWARDNGIPVEVTS
jgi:hypothetical protein